MPIIVQWNFQSDKKVCISHLVWTPGIFPWPRCYGKNNSEAALDDVEVHGLLHRPWTQPPLYFCATGETTIRHRSMTASSASQVQFQHIFSSVFIFLSCTAADPEVKVFISPCILPLFLHLLQRLETFTLRLHAASKLHHVHIISIPSTAEAPKLCFAFAKPRTHNSARLRHHWGSHTSLLAYHGKPCVQLVVRISHISGTVVIVRARRLCSSNNTYSLYSY